MYLDKAHHLVLGIQLGDFSLNETYSPSPSSHYLPVVLQLECATRRCNIPQPSRALQGYLSLLVMSTRIVIVHVLIKKPYY